MKRFSQIGLIALTVMFLVGSFGVIESNAQVVNKIKRRMQKHSNALKSLKGNIEQGMHDVVLDEYDIKSGNLSYLPGGKSNFALRVDWVKPIREILSIVKGKYILYTPRLKQYYYGKVSNAKKNTKSAGALRVMTMNKSQMDANYSISYLGVEKVLGKDMWHLKLTPKKKTSYKYAELWVDGNGMPIQSKIIQKNDDSMTIRLTKIQKNVSIKGSIFVVDLPKGVKKIKG